MATVNIYQAFTRLFVNKKGKNQEFGSISENGVSKFGDITPGILQGIKEFGVTHLWLTGVIRHSTCTSYQKHDLMGNNPLIVKGVAGSPYAIQDYYDVDPDLATDASKRMNEFELLVKRAHKAGLKVIIDFVPNHVSRQYKSLQKPVGVRDLGEGDDTTVHFSAQNNFYYLPGQQLHLPQEISFPYTVNADEYHEFPARVTGNDVFSATPSINDWYETIKLNYGVDYSNGWNKHFNPTPDTWFKMRDILAFWVEKGVDAFRCDMAEMVPVEFWAWVIPQIKALNSEIIFIAEVYNPQEYNSFIKKGGFDYLYDKVGLYDTLRLIVEGHGSTTYITDYWRAQGVDSEKLVRFLENHDEQRIASPQFAGDAWAGVPAMMVNAFMNNSALMVYFGQEIGEAATDKEGYSGRDGRTSIFDYWHLPNYRKLFANKWFEPSALEPWQQQLFEVYRKMFQLRLDKEALREGGFYDIMWVNMDGNLNHHKIYAFIRHTRNQKLLVIVNFDRYNKQGFRLRLPEHAFDHIGMEKDYLYRATDLISGGTVSFHGQQAISFGVWIEIGAKWGVVYELS